MVREVTPDEVQSKLDGDDADVTVVDIRSPSAFEQGHVPGAINVPLPRLPQRVDEREWDADEIVCVCPLGESSIQAARLLGSYERIEAGTVASMDGGYRAWDAELETGPESGGGATAGGGGSNSQATDEGPEAPF